MTREKLLFSKTNASVIVRTLPHGSSELAELLIKKIEEFSNCVLVVARGKRPTFVSKKKFYEEFVESRKQRAIELCIWKNNRNTYTIHNPLNGNRYSVECLPDRLECSCDDYLNQVKAYGRGVCKHGYRTLSEIGYKSLKEYISRSREQP